MFRYVPQQRYRELVIDSIYNKDIDMSEIVSDHEINNASQILFGDIEENYQFTNSITLLKHNIYVREEFKKEFEEKFLIMNGGWGSWGSWTSGAWGSGEYVPIVDTIVDYTLLVSSILTKSDPDLQDINGLVRIHSPPVLPQITKQIPFNI